MMSVQDVGGAPVASKHRPYGLSEALPVSSVPLKRQVRRKISAYEKFGGKRLLDIAIASMAILFLLPILPIIVLALVIQDGAPVLFRQNRVGQGGRLFECLKFRSMVRDSDRRLNALLSSCERSRKEWQESQKLRQDPRIHKVGSLLRRSSLDELPQLWNVLRGDMSIVGPRPIMADQVARYRDNFAGYAKAKPGITGPWQVGGRNKLTFDQRIGMDAGYAETVGFVSDLKIITKTVWVVLAGQGSF